MLLGYLDQQTILRGTALMAGCPNIRFVVQPRVGIPSEVVASVYDKVVKALTDPLTAKEKEAGLYSPPTPPRVLFEGTLDEAQDFLQQTVLMENCRMCPIAKYTDGLPVIIPTEEKVAQMLTGTSHKASEQILATTTMSSAGIMKTVQTAGAPLNYGQGMTSTVEKVAICAVMAGCLPEYMPAVLAMAATGGGYLGWGQTSSMQPTSWLVSGPYAKEIGMNAGQDAMDIGNRANMSLGRVAPIMWVNFGGQIAGIGRSDSGNPIHQLCFAEDIASNPPGWVSYAEECTYTNAAGQRVNYTSKDSVLGKGGAPFSYPMISMPGYYRALTAGTGGLARLLGVEGKPGWYNWVEALVKFIIPSKVTPGGLGLIVHPSLATQLYDHGFKTKLAYYNWLSGPGAEDRFGKITVMTRYLSGMWEWGVADNMGGYAIESTSGLRWDVLLATAPDYGWPAFGTNPNSNFIVISDGFQDEHWYQYGRPSGSSIDIWR